MSQQPTKVLKPVLVKFNCRTSVHMIPDADYPKVKEMLAKMKFEDFKSYKERMMVGSEYQYIDVEIGQQLEVPGWYFEEYKDNYVDQSLSIENYKDKEGNPTPFNTEDAMRHRYIDSPDQTMKRVKRFDVVI